MRLTLFAAVSLTVFASIELAAADGPVPPVTDNARWLAGVDLAAYLDCAREQRVTLLQAHRAGDRPGAAENSLAAIEASLADGAVFIEIDVARTADGVLVLMHDDDLDRTTTGSGELAETPWSVVSTLELVDVDGQPTGERVPTFAAALAALDGRGVAQVDLKDVDAAEVLAALDVAGARDRAVIITYTLEEAITLSKTASDVLFSVGIRSLDDLADLDAAGVNLTRVSAWLGLGLGDPELDAALAERGVETSFGDFRSEREGAADYALMAARGAELISVDDVPAAIGALNGAGAGPRLLASCPAAQPRL